MESVASYIDHTLLKPEAGDAKYRQLFQEATKYNFYTVCVPQQQIAQAKQQLAGSPVKVCTVVGFPLGYSLAEAKAFEAERATHMGADEVDMVLSIAALKQKKYSQVKQEIALVKAESPVLKVIIESCLLSPEEIITASKLCVEAGADFVKTSTGFSTGGASLEAIDLIREAVEGQIKIKASGGISGYAMAKAYVERGCHRLGTSQSCQIMKEFLMSGENTARP